MTAVQLRGVYVPLVTPFGDHGSIDFASLQRLANESLDAGAAGLVALATTGEVTSLTEAERDGVVQALSEVSADRASWASTVFRRCSNTRARRLSKRPRFTRSWWRHSIRRARSAPRRSVRDRCYR